MAGGIGGGQPLGIEPVPDLFGSCVSAHEREDRERVGANQLVERRLPLGFEATALLAFQRLAGSPLPRLAALAEALGGRRPGAGAAVTIRELADALGAAWSSLTQQGVWSLTAQSRHETNDGKNCFNWNLGNVKAADPNLPHMYLRHNAEMENGRRVVREPPHPSCRFRAYASLADGVAHWIKYFSETRSAAPRLPPILECRQRCATRSHSP